MDGLDKFAEIVAMVPGTFWGVFIGSFFALGGVMLSNRASDRRLRAQFEYERELRNRDRELALRKDIYLAATEAISAGLESVAKMADLEIPTKEISEGYLKRAPAIAKIHVIGNEETLKAVINISSELSKTFMQLNVKRGLLLSKKQEIANLDELIAKFGQDRDRMTELMKQYNLQGLADERLWKTIEANLKFEAERFDRTLEQKTNLLGALIADQLNLAKECVKELNGLSRLLVSVVVAVRKELEIPIDGKNYERMIEESVAKLTDNVTQFLEQIRTLVTAQYGLAVNDPDETPVS